MNESIKLKPQTAVRESYIDSRLYAYTTYKSIEWVSCVLYGALLPGRLSMTHQVLDKLVSHLAGKWLPSWY